MRNKIHSGRRSAKTCVQFALESSRAPARRRQNSGGASQAPLVRAVQRASSALLCPSHARMSSGTANASAPAARVAAPSALLASALGVGALTGKHNRPAQRGLHVPNHRRPHLPSRTTSMRRTSADMPSKVAEVFCWVAPKAFSFPDLLPCLQPLRVCNGSPQALRSGVTDFCMNRTTNLLLKLRQPLEAPSSTGGAFRPGLTSNGVLIPTSAKSTLSRGRRRSRPVPSLEAFLAG